MSPMSHEPWAGLRSVVCWKRQQQSDTQNTSDTAKAIQESEAESGKETGPSNFESLKFESLKV